ncbi:MAG: DUF362 domain-containing protein [bacterium]|nr:DUF362 domain-containing protein [bacterium]
MTVCIKKVCKYNIGRIQDSLSQSLELLNFKLSHKKTAILKPNIVMPAKPRTAIVTHPAVVEATINLLRDAGIEDISIVEEPAIGLDVKESFRVSGYTELADRIGVNLYGFDDIEKTEMKWKYGTLKIPKIFLDADLYINLPKIKTHGYTTVTLSIKNQKGLVSSQIKKYIHTLGLHVPLIELARVISPHLIIMDGICAMEGDGPTQGKSKRLNALIVGTNQLECDIAASRLMGIDPCKVTHLAYGISEGLGEAEPVIIGDSIQLLMKQFLPANLEYGRKLNIYAWRNPAACSMCMDSFHKAVKEAVLNPKWWLSFVSKFAWYALFSRVNILQGKNASLPPLPGWNVCFGTCTRELAKEKGFAYVPGCPPVSDDILKSFFSAS